MLPIKYLNGTASPVADASATVGAHNETRESNDKFGLFRQYLNQQAVSCGEQLGEGNDGVVFECVVKGEVSTELVFKSAKLFGSTKMMPQRLLAALNLSGSFTGSIESEALEHAEEQHGVNINAMFPGLGKCHIPKPPVNGLCWPVLTQRNLHRSSC